MTKELSDEARDMLANAEMRIGGMVGVGSEEAEQELREATLIGRNAGLTRLGLQLARRYHREWLERP